MFNFFKKKEKEVTLLYNNEIWTFDKHKILKRSKLSFKFNL